jgi:hypothetical protein
MTALRLCNLIADGLRSAVKLFRNLLRVHAEQQQPRDSLLLRFGPQIHGASPSAALHELTPFSSQKAGDYSSKNR